MVLSVSEKNFSQTVLESSQPVLVHFWAPWCGLCRIVNPSLLKLQSESSQQIKVVSINADENFKLANTYRLTSLPTLLLFDQGRLIQRLEDFPQERETIHQSLEKIKFSLLAQSA